MKKGKFNAELFAIVISVLAILFTVGMILYTVLK